MLKKIDELQKLANLLEGLPVLSCVAASPAGRAGIRYGDIVLSVNGEATRDWHSYVTARAVRDDAMVVVLFRDGIEHTLTVPL